MKRFVRSIEVRGLRWSKYLRYCVSLVGFRFYFGVYTKFA